MAVNRMMELFLVAMLVGALGFVSGRGPIKGVPWRRRNSQMQLKTVVLDEGDSPHWEGLGCYKDTSERALRDFLGYSSGNTAQEIIKDCAAKAVAKGYVYFGVQYYLECWGDKDGHLRYDKHGKAGNCQDGIGRGWSNYVYKITRVEGYCVAHFKLYKYNSLVNEDPCETCRCLSSGHVVCQHAKCKHLPLNCERNVTLPGKCCPVCECYHQGTHYKDGDTWWWPISDKGCEQCSCKSSQAVCNIQVCPICSSYVDRPGKCCRDCASVAPIIFTIIPTTELIMTLPTPPPPP